MSQVNGSSSARSVPNTAVAGRHEDRPVIQCHKRPAPLRPVCQAEVKPTLNDALRTVEPEGPLGQLVEMLGTLRNLVDELRGGRATRGSAAGEVAGGIAGESAAEIEGAAAALPGTPPQPEAAGESSRTEISSLESSVERLFTRGPKKINEEQLYAANLLELLNVQSPELGELFSETFQEARKELNGSANAIENGAVAALKALVSTGLVSEDMAQKLNGLAFAASQLDDNKAALYDSKGDDSTAVKATDRAIKSAESFLAQAFAGEVPIKPRPLKAASSGTPNTGGAPASGGSATASPAEVGFLWKPVSDSDSKLAVLLPPKYTGQVEGLAIYRALPPSQANLLENGRNGGVGNGDRTHFRFSKAGSAYPDGCYVVATLKNGETVAIKIDNTADRVEGTKR